MKTMKYDKLVRDRIPEMEYAFCDTGKELKETYVFIDKLEAFLNAHIIRIPKELPGFSKDYDFDYFIELFNGYLPSPPNRWCTKELKLKPFEHYIGEDTVINYVGIRADEARVGYISTKPNVETVFPFIEDDSNSSKAPVEYVAPTIIVNLFCVNKVDVSSIKDIMHKLKSSALSMGASTVANLAIEIENLARNDDSKSFDLLPDLYEAFQITISSFNDYKKKLK